MSRLLKTNPAYKPLYLGSWNSQGRAKKKALQKNSWYKNKEGGQKGPKPANKKKIGKGWKPKAKQPSSVIFVPNTKGGILIGKLREKEEELSKLTGFRIKYQEAGGLQLRNVFSTDLAKGKHCGRKVCPPCDQSSENRQNCRTQNILYETKCLVCNPSEGTKEERNNQKAGRSGIYYGESSRSFHERMVEHVRDADKFSNKSHIIKHWMLSHKDLDQRPPFAFKVINKYKDCLSRQVGEAIKIQHTTDNILNSKCEYLSNCLTRLTVLEDDWERKKREKDEEIEKKKIVKRLQPAGRGAASTC